MKREEMVRLLVVGCLECSGSLWGALWLQKMLENGFRGYANMSDRELAAEIEARGLDRLYDPQEGNEDLPSPDDDLEVAMLVHQCKEGLRD